MREYWTESIEKKSYLGKQSQAKWRLWQIALRINDVKTQDIRRLCVDHCAFGSFPPRPHARKEWLLPT